MESLTHVSNTLQNISLDPEQKQSSKGEDQIDSAKVQDIEKVSMNKYEDLLEKDGNEKNK